MADTVGRLFGRADELALIDSALTAMRDGPASAVGIVADPGIGKTRLLAEIGRGAEERRFLVLAGRASELEIDLPYGVFVDALDDYLRTVDQSWLSELDQRSDRELSRIFPALTGVAVDHATILDERYRVHRAARMLLEELASERPLVLLLDDLQWADQASVDLLGTLCRRPPSASVLLAIAVRPKRAPPRLVAVLDDAARSGSMTLLEPRALSENDVEKWLGPTVSPQEARMLYLESGGNPFFLEQLSRARVPGSGPDLGERVIAAVAPNENLPPPIARSFTSELAELPADARVLLEAAAVVGDPFELDLAASAANAAEPDALAALDALLGADLVVSTDVPRRFQFRHPLLRKAVYDATSSAWRIAAHERAARALEARGEPATSSAHHVEQSAAFGDLDAVRVLCEAADASAQRAPATAARWYRAALALLPQRAQNIDERTVLLRQLARVLAGVGQFEESRDVLLELLAATDEAETTSRVKATAACAGLEHLLGRHEDAHTRLVQALDEVDASGSADGASLMLDLAMDAYFGRDLDRMRRWGAQALEVAERIDDRPLTAAAHAIVCLGDAYADDVVSAEAHRTRTRRLVDGLDDDELAQRLDAVANLGAAEIYLGRYEDALVHLRRGLTLGRTTGQGELFPLLTQELGVALDLLGRLDESQGHREAALEAVRLAPTPQSLSWSLMNSAWTTMLTGDLEMALQLAEKSAELARELDDSPITTWSAAILGAVLIEMGQPARGVDVIHAGAGGPQLASIPGFFRVTIMERVTDALLTLVRHEDADQAASHAEELAAATGLAMSRAQAARARAAVLLAADDARAAATRALEAAAAADEIDARIDAARCRTLAGRALHAAGERERATEALTTAAETLDACGAIRYRDEAERELRRLGRRDHRRRGGERADGGRLEALTARELEIARLVVDRKTNPEIAAELFLSQKTVETHLRNAFRKLGVSSRVELARAVERADRSNLESSGQR